MKKITIAAVTALLLLLAAPASAQETSTADLSALNGSGASSQVEMTLDGTSLTVTITGTGFSPGLVHAQHIHFAAGTDSICPGADADTDDDGLVSTVEGVPFYGGVQFSLTTEGDFTGESGLAIDRFPTADGEGNLNFERTFELDEAMVQSLAGQEFAVVQHGIDLDESGAYDGDAVSSLDETLPLEATIPAACGVMGVQVAADTTTTTVADDATPVGGADTGAGGAADGGIWDPSLFAVMLGALAIGAGGYVATRRAKHES